MKLIGLTGGIASGKSFVESMFKKAGIPVVDADALSHEVTAPNTVGLAKVIAHFGEKYLKSDGTLDRASLSSLVFSNKEARENLEKIVHPLIHEAMQNKLNELKSHDHPYVIYCAPLIFEKNLQDGFEAVILVDCDEQNQIMRLLQRDQLSQADAWLRLSAQMPIAKKRELTTFLVDNNGSKSHCATSLSKVWNSITNQSVIFEP